MTVEDLFKRLIIQAKHYYTDEEVSQLRKSYSLAEKAHEGQFRKSKKPYITHPLEVALILCELEQDIETVMAGILHDTVEDTKVSAQDIEELLGPKVKDLVAGVTKLSKLRFSSKEEAQAENYRRLFLAMADDYRVIIIKLADRLHNLRTLQFMPEHKQRRIALETLDIYAPIAHRLGIGGIKWELEDLSFRYIYPDEFQKIKTFIESSRKDRETYIQGMANAVSSIMTKAKLPAIVSGRPKHLYSIFKKTHNTSKSLQDLYDLRGVRVIVESVSQCYAALGEVHATFKPISERFKDYIALPKSNGYQSIHTTVVGLEGKPVEIQIRTKEMQHAAEFGFAAHWHYKSNSNRKNLEGRLNWLKNIVELQDEELEPLDFLQTIKGNLYDDEVFVFTPKGDVKALARGSTVLDFAYAVHTEVGHCFKGGLVNGDIVPINYELKNGDRVDILTTKTPNPKVDWLSIVVSRHARYKIKQWLNKKNRVELILEGKKRLERAFFIEGLVLEDTLEKINSSQLFEQFHLSKIDDLYLYIEQGDLSSKEVIRFCLKKLEEIKAPEITIKKHKKERETLPDGVEVLGEKNIQFSIAKCCSPIPGDEISGIIVIGKGVSIHRTDCKNLADAKTHANERIIAVRWDSENIQKRSYVCCIHIEGYDREGLLQDLLRVIYESKITLREVNTKVFKDNTRMQANFSVELRDIKQFYELKTRLSAIPDVYSVSRVSIGLV